MVYDASVTCPYCFENFWLAVDPSDGETQRWIWDCEVCCRPIDVSAAWSEEAGEYLCSGERSQ